MNINDINLLYDKSNLPKEMLRHQSRGLTVPFDPSWKNIAVNVSGGADSAMLASSLAEIITENKYDCKIHFISFVRVWEFRPWAPFISLEVYNKIKEMFPDAIGSRIESFIPTELEEGVSGGNLLNDKSGDRIIVNSFNKYCTYRFGLDAVYNATTLNPEDESVGIFDGDNKRPKDREPKWYEDKGVNALVVENQSKNTSWTIYPYRYTDKRYVIQGYHDNNWLDLFHLTRSCEGDKNTDPDLFPSYLGYQHGISKLVLCGHCFWCVEREWALNKVIKSDT